MKDIIQADVPKDLSKIKTKIFFNLTKRQLLCFGCGAVIGIPLYFLTRSIYKDRARNRSIMRTCQ